MGGPCLIGPGGGPGMGPLGLGPFHCGCWNRGGPWFICGGPLKPGGGPCMGGPPGGPPGLCMPGGPPIGPLMGEPPIGGMPRWL